MRSRFAATHGFGAARPRRGGGSRDRAACPAGAGERPDRRPVSVPGGPAAALPAEPALSTAAVGRAVRFRAAAAAAGRFLARARAAARRRQRPTTKIMVFGDSMADWLAYGLEEAFADTPEIGVLRKHRTNSGLIRVEVRGESYDWPTAARDLLNAEKPDYVVMMHRRGGPARHSRSDPATAGATARRPEAAASQQQAANAGAARSKQRSRPRSSRPQRRPRRPRRSRRTPKRRRKARRRTPRRTAINRTSSRPKPRSPERWCTNSAPRNGASSIHGASMK